METETTLRPSGISAVGDVPWGTHLCHLFRTREELEDCLVPYFQAGLENNELCLWVTSEPLHAAEAWESMRRRLPDVDRFVERKQFEIIDFDDWYRRTGAMDADATVAAWQQREAEALARGLDGLRLTGNTSWLQKKDRMDFADYEAMVHQSFRNRRMLALCSYSLDECGHAELAEVLRNHKFALLRRSGRWEISHSATVLLSAAASGDPEAAQRATQHHDVQFYEERQFLVGKLTEYVHDGLELGESVVIIAEPHVRTALVKELQVRGHDPKSSLRMGQLVLLDAREVLGLFMAEGEPDRARFESAIDPIIRASIAKYGRARLYGEMVNVLMEEGNAAGALELEVLWNEILLGKPASLLCGYRLSEFTDPELLRHVSARHESVHPGEQLRELDNVVDAGRLMGELQHRTHLLDSETRSRRELEHERTRILDAERRARRQAELATNHLDRLQAVTAALSEAATPADVARVVVTEMAKAVEAEKAVVVIPVEEGKLELLGHAGLQKPIPSGLAEFSIDARQAIAESYRSRRPQWLTSRRAVRESFDTLLPKSTRAFACLPLFLGPKQLGVIGFGYRANRDFSAAEQMLFFDLAKQASLALDRSLLLQRAEEANLTKDAFLAMLGHELRNPLSPIVTSLQLMRLKDGDESFGRELDVIERQADNLVRLVNDLLDVSRITQGRVSLETECVETDEVVARAVEMAGPLIQQRSHRLRVDVARSGLPLEVDPGRIAQVLANLLINAAKYTEPGGRIEISAFSENDEIVIQVKDDGPGIPPAILPRLFDLFSQGERTPERSQGGLGLGLTIARSLVELHGGTISARSDSSRAGAELTVRLPRGPESRSPAAEPRLGAVRSVAAPATGRVLIVDDNEDGADALAEGLRGLGYSVRVAYEPAAGLTEAEEFSPQVALLDIGLPSFDGYELASRLRSIPGLEDIYVVALTGYGRETDYGRSRTAGFDAHLVKPAELSTVHGVLRSAPCASAPENEPQDA